MVGHQIAMSISISELKQGIQSGLRQADGFIKYNEWGNNLEARTAGYAVNLHPVHHNREKVQQDIASFLTDTMRADGLEQGFPEFKVVPSSAGDNKSNKKVSTRFLAIECRNETNGMWTLKVYELLACVDSMGILMEVLSNIFRIQLNCLCSWYIGLFPCFLVDNSEVQLSKWCSRIIEDNVFINDNVSVVLMRCSV
jgi:hypothetical protein